MARELFDACGEAVGDLNYVYATTARPRGMVKPVHNPRGGRPRHGGAVGRGQRVGILFGRERFGLRNEEVALADVIVMAPVDPAFASLNIAQAVLLMGYEWFKRGGHQHRPGDAAATGLCAAATCRWPDRSRRPRRNWKDSSRN